MTEPKISNRLLILITGLAYLSLVGCSGVPSQSATGSIPATTPLLEEVQPTQTKILVSPTSTSTAAPALPTATQPEAATPTAAETATNTPLPTPAPMTAVKEENGWVTYRNEVIGYEISAPKSYVIKGASPGHGVIGPNLLGPGVPDEEIVRLLSRYYGDSLYVWILGTDPISQKESLHIGIYAYDIIENDLGGIVSPSGMGDYQLTSRQETLQIDWHSYPVTFTVELRDQQPVGELAVLYLEKDGIELMFGYIQPKDDPAAYQAYLKEFWPEIRKIIESYRKLPENTSLADIPSVNASALNDASDLPVPPPQAIARALFEQYLAPFSGNPLDSLMKLSAYTIEEVQIPTRWQACAAQNKAEFIAEITYSVKPQYWPPERWNDDGYSTFDQWIKRKKAAVAVFRSGEDYTMKILDHPICPGF